MEILIGILAVTWMLRHAAAGIAYAVRGVPPPRTQERIAAIEYGAAQSATKSRSTGRPAGTPGRTRYGFRDLVADSWFDGCERARQGQLERRARGKSADPDAVDRIERAPQRFGWFAAAAKRTGRALWNPVGETAPTNPAIPAEPLPPGGPVPGNKPGVQPRATPAPSNGTGQAGSPEASPRSDREALKNAVLKKLDDEKEFDDEGKGPGGSAPPSQNQHTGGPPMGTATGEAVNYETAVHQIDLMLDDLRDINTHLEGIDSEVSDLAQASATLGGHLAALDLDADTLGPVNAAADTLGPEALKELFERIDAARTSLDAARDHIVATFADAAQTVATTGVNSDFVAA